MVLRIPRPIGLTALVYALFLAGGGIGASVNIARADDCLPAPNSSTPHGSHWYYRMDWAKQRKCWYLRAPDQSPQAAPQDAPEAAAAAPSTPAPAVTPGDAGAPSAHVKMLSVKPQQSMMSATTDNPVGPLAPQGNGMPPISQAPARPANLPPPGVQTPAPAAVTGAAWPDPPSAIAAPAATNAVSNDAAAGSPGRKADPRTSEDSESAVGRAASAATAAAPQSMTATPVEMLLALALGLAAAGILSRIVMKFAAARREPIITERAEPDWIGDNTLDDDTLDDKTLQPEFLDDWSDQEFAAQSDRHADIWTEQSEPPAPPWRRRSPAAPAWPSATAEDLEATESVIMRALQRTP